MRRKILLVLGLIFNLLSLYSAENSVGRDFFVSVYQYCVENNSNLFYADVSLSSDGEEIYCFDNVVYRYPVMGAFTTPDYYVEEKYQATLFKNSENSYIFSINENFWYQEFYDKECTERLSAADYRSFSMQNKNNEEKIIKILSEKFNSVQNCNNETYLNYRNIALTDSSFLAMICKGKSALWLKSFMKKKEISGRQIKTDLILEKISESEKSDFLFKAEGTVLLGKSIIKIPQKQEVDYSNLTSYYRTGGFGDPSSAQAKRDYRALVWDAIGKSFGNMGNSISNNRTQEKKSTWELIQQQHYLNPESGKKVENPQDAFKVYLVLYTDDERILDVKTGNMMAIEGKITALEFSGNSLLITVSR